MTDRCSIRRGKRAARGEREELRESFWIAFRALLGRLAGGNYFCQDFSGECSDGHPVGWDQAKVSAALAEALGSRVNPLTDVDPPPTT